MRKYSVGSIPHMDEDAAKQAATELLRICNAQSVEIERLQVIVNNVPKCWRLNEAGKLVQDVSVVPKMVVWVSVTHKWDEPRKGRVCYVSVDSVCVDYEGGGDDWAFCDSLYSTRKAAEAKEK